MVEGQKIRVALFRSRCSICDLLINPGDVIICVNGSWAHETCYWRERRAERSVIELRAIMETKHHIALGVFGVPAGCRATMTRGEFLRAAVEKGEVSDEDLKLIRWYWSGLLERALDD